jgi:hypothetical protein
MELFFSHRTLRNQADNCFGMIFEGNERDQLAKKFALEFNIQLKEFIHDIDLCKKTHKPYYVFKGQES